MKLSKITKQETGDLLNQLDVCQKERAELVKILSSRNLVSQRIIHELDDIQTKYGDDRRTEIVNEEPIKKIDCIKDIEELLIFGKNTICREKLENYRLQHRAGKGLKIASTDEGHSNNHILPVQTLSKILMFSSRGMVFCVPALNIPTKRNKYSKATNIADIIDISFDDYLKSSLVINKEQYSNDVVISSVNGKIKKVSLEKLLTNRSKGKRAMTLNPGDEIMQASVASPQHHILCYTQNGKVAMYPPTEIPYIKSLGGKGVKAMTLKKGDTMKGFISGDLSDNKFLFSYGIKGFGKLTPMSIFPERRNRPSVGILAMKLDKKTGSLGGMFYVDKEDQIMFITALGKSIRIGMKEVRTTSRVTKGVKLINLEKNDHIVYAKIIPNSEENNEEKK